MTVQELETHLFLEKEKSVLYSFDAFYLKIKDEPKNFVIYISLKGFSETFDKSIQRPYVAIMHLKKPYSQNMAKEKACEYLSYLQTSIIAQV